MTRKLIEAKNISKYFKVGKNNIRVLENISLDVFEGDFLIIIGPSGCGKSTLLNILLGLELPTGGSLTIADFKVYENTTEDDRSDFRKQVFGIIHQMPLWIRSLNVWENTSIPLMLLGEDVEECEIKSVMKLRELGISQWAYYSPSELSGGQQQKVAVARALINDPSIIVADEPTGNLDQASGKQIVEMLKELNLVQKKTIIMVTHDLSYLKYCTRSINMLDGQIIEQKK